jgi:hypothetical protein
MAINLAYLIFEVRGNLNDIDIVHYDDKLVFKDLTAAYDHFVMLSDYTLVDMNNMREESLKRCLINLATFYGYRNATRLVSTNPGAGPEGTSLNVLYDQNRAKACMELLFGVKLDEDLVPVLMERKNIPTVGTIGPSILDVFSE